MHFRLIEILLTGVVLCGTQLSLFANGEIPFLYETQAIFYEEYTLRDSALVFFFIHAVIGARILSSPTKPDDKNPILNFKENRKK